MILNRQLLQQKQDFKKRKENLKKFGFSFFLLIHYLCNGRRINRHVIHAYQRLFGVHILHIDEFIEVRKLVYERFVSKYKSVLISIPDNRDVLYRVLKICPERGR